MFGISQEAPKQALMMEVMQAKQGGEAFPVGKKVEQLSRQPVVSRLPRSRPWPGVGAPVRQVQRSVRFGSPGLLETVIAHLKVNWKWYLGGTVAFVVLLALVSGGQKDEREEKERGSQATC